MINEETKLIDELEFISKSKKEIEAKEEEIRRTIIELAKKENRDLLFGTNKNCLVKEYEKVIYPEDKTLFQELIKKKGLYGQFSSLNYFKLSPKIIKGEIDKDIIDLIRKEKAYRLVMKDRNKLVVG